MFNADKRVPVTVLTGFLGSGKTTLLNRLLKESHGKRIAVIENEFGEIGIDSELVIGVEEEIFSMNNGCLCCTVRGDLIRTLGDLAKRKDKFDYVLIETTGLANPGPVTQTFFMDEGIEKSFRLDGVVTLVDTKHVALHLDDSEECREQIGFADIVLLNKTDLMEPSAVDALERRIRTMNRATKIYRTHNAEIELDKVLGQHAFDLNSRFEIAPEAEPVTQSHDHEHHVHDHHDHDAEHCEICNHEGHDHEHGDHDHDHAHASHDHKGHDHHHHDESVTSVGIDVLGQCDSNRLNEWLGKLLNEKGEDIFRMKGVLSIRGQNRRFVFQGIHMMFGGEPDRAWAAREPRRNQLVFIGRNLDREALTQGFMSCLT